MDAAGIALPHTPQLLALLALRDACSKLEASAAAGAEAGADSACTAQAAATAAQLRSQLAARLMEEAVRVEAARAAHKKKKGGAKKK
jgi:hypothetical protein